MQSNARGDYELGQPPSHQLAGAGRQMMASNNHLGNHGLVMNPSQSSHHSSTKQRLKSATMNKRINRGLNQNDDIDDDRSNNQQYHGYTGHLSNNDMQSVSSNPQMNTR